MRRAVTFLVSILLSSCASTTPSPSSYGFIEDCIVVDESPERVSSLTTGSTRLHSTESTIAHGSTEEQILMHQLYETLTWIDCTNTVRRGLASSWHGSDDHQEWTFVIRPEARFWNGASITAEELIKSLDDPWTSDARIESFRAESARELRFVLNEPDPNFPRRLADPRYAVYRSSPGIDWNIGSGPFTIESVRVSRSFDRSNSITSIIRTVSDINPVRRRSIVFHSSNSTDARDFITDGLDVVIAVDPVVSRYALDSAEYVDFPLPWDKSYVVAWGFQARDMSGSRKPLKLPEKLAASFLNDIAPAEARPGTIPNWYAKFTSCSRGSGSTDGAHPEDNNAPAIDNSVAPLRRILYDENDPIARALAGRLSALSSSSPADPVAAKELEERLPEWSDRGEMIPALPVSSDILNRSIKEGSDLYYVLPLPRRVLDYCTIESRSYAIHGGNLVLNTSDPFNFLPLIDTRQHLLISSAVSGLSFDWFGNLRFVP